MTAPVAPVSAALPDADQPLVLDAAALEGLSQLDPGGHTRLVERVLQTYLASLARLMGQMRAGLDSGELGAVRVAAHTLKSSSASIGATAFAAHCAAVEQALRRGDVRHLAAQHERLRAEADEVSAAVGAVLDGLSGSSAPPT